MQGTAEIHDYLLSIFPTADSELLDLFASAWENANLAYSDFCTINDLLDCSGYRQSAALHVLLLDLFLALEDGSSCIQASAEGLARRLRDLADDERAASLAQEILTTCQPQSFPELIGTGPDEGKPVVLWEQGGQRFFYFQRYLRSELKFAAELQARLMAPPAPADLVQIREALRHVLVEQPLLRLGNRQHLAVALALLRNFVVISGGPGSGKTSIAVSLLRSLVRCGFAPERIALAAPTGRAAQRLTDAVRSGLSKLPAACSLEERRLAELEAQTLHHLLRYSPTRGIFLCHAENPIAADVIIVDEVSMVGLGLMAQLLQATRPETKLILLGDKDQLPSVEAGAVLASLLPDNAVPTCSPELCQQLHDVLPDGDVAAAETDGPLRDTFVLLDENYRSQPHIRTVARAINDQSAAIVDELPILSMNAAALADAENQGGCWWLPQDEANLRQFQAELRVWAERQYLASSFAELLARAAVLEEPDAAGLDPLFRIVNRARLLTVVREGPFGCVDINHLFDEMLRPHLDRSSRGDLFAGAPVLITRNDYTRRLFNGDIGVTLKSPQGGYRVAFARQDGYAAFPADTLPSHELGFALTVHKSQGSEYDEVLLVLPSAGGRRLLTKEIVYTGITRAKRLAVISGTKEVLRAAISRRIVRDSGLGASVQAAAHC